MEREGNKSGGTVKAAAREKKERGESKARRNEGKKEKGREKKKIKEDWKAKEQLGLGEVGEKFININQM